MTNLRLVYVTGHFVHSEHMCRYSPLRWTLWKVCYTTHMLEIRSESESC